MGDSHHCETETHYLNCNTQKDDNNIDEIIMEEILCDLSLNNSKEEYHYHCAAVEDSFSPPCDELNDNRSSSSNLESDEESKEIWQCLDCKKDFKTENQYKNHIRSKKHKEKIKKKNKNKV